MSKAKSGDWWRNEGHRRRLANNSVAYTEKPDFEVLSVNEMQNMYESKAGERGIFSSSCGTKNCKLEMDVGVTLIRTLVLILAVRSSYAVISSVIYLR